MRDTFSGCWFLKTYSEEEFSSCSNVQVYWWGKEEPGGVEQYEVKGHLVWIVRNQCSSHEVNLASGHGIDSAVDDTMLKPSYGSLTIARGQKLMR